MTVRVTISISDEIASVLDAEALKKAKAKMKSKGNRSDEVAERLIRTMVEDGLLRKDEAENK